MNEITGPHKPWSRTHPKAFRRLLEWSLVLLATAAGVIALRQPVSGEAIQPPVSRPLAQTAKGTQTTQKAPQKPVSALKRSPITGTKSYLATVTAFSDQECGSAWCDRHEPKDGQAAVNYSTIGKVCHVYVPAYDRTYRVVGNTDGRTDLDIWFGSDHDAALAFGSKILLINPIPCS